MNARKLPSGRWQSKVYVGTVDGKKIFVTVTEDSRRDCLLKAAQVKAEAEANAESPKISVQQAIERYIEAKRGVLSPSTVAGYTSKLKLYIITHPIASCRIDQINNQKVQAWISDISGGRSKKTVASAYGLLTASLRMFRKIDLDVRLPQGKRYEGYVPSTEEVFTVLEYARAWDERLYRACLLSAFGTLRRGEICALTAADIRGSFVHVDKDMVKDENGKWITKLPKTEDSVRDVQLPSWILQELPKEGPLVDYRPDEITKWFGKAVRKAGLPHFRFHDLRKHAVSLMATQGVSMASIKEIGGWSNLNTPQQIYIKALADAHKREMSQYIGHLENLNPSKSFAKVSSDK